MFFCRSVFGNFGKGDGSLDEGVRVIENVMSIYFLVLCLVSGIYGELCVRILDSLWELVRD